MTDGRTDERPRQPCVFALGASRALGERVAAALGVALAAHEEREFEDGEHKLRPLESVRGRDCHVLHSLHGDAQHSPDDKLLRLLSFIATLKDASAARVTAVVPYLCFARKDRRTQPRDPVTLRHVATLFEAVGTDRIITLEVHNPAAYENAFRIPCEHLESAALFAGALARQLAGRDCVVVSPDTGGAKRAHRCRDALGAALGKSPSMIFIDKTRALGRIGGEAVTGQLQGRVAVIVDDLVSTGATLARAADACLEGGATGIIAAACHGLFTGEAARILADAPLERLLISDSVPPFRLPAPLVAARLTVLGTAGLFATAIAAMHQEDSLFSSLPPGANT